MTTSMYVVESHPNKERLAVEHLGLQGFDPLLPLALRGGRVRPLFPRILFVSADLGVPGMRDYFRAVSYTRGVRRVFGGERPSAMPAREASVIIAQCAGGPLDETAWRALVVGMQVTVSDGAWRGWDGLIECFDDDRRRAQLVIGAWRVWQEVQLLEHAA
jgi:transcription antitermination factor NusG